MSDVEMKNQARAAMAARGSPMNPIGGGEFAAVARASHWRSLDEVAHSYADTIQIPRT